MLIEPLTREHNCKILDCADKAVTRFLSGKALQDQERDLSRTMVLIDVAETVQRATGHHTLVMSQIRQEETPSNKPKITRGIPVILLGQIGTDVNFQICC